MAACAQIQYSEKYYDDVNEYRWVSRKCPATGGLQACDSSYYGHPTCILS